MRVRRLVLFAFLTLVHTPASGLAAQAAHPARALSHPLISRKQALVTGLILTMTIMGDQGLRGEFQEHRGNTTNSLAGVGNALGEPRYLLPAIGAGYLVGHLTGDRALTRIMLHAGGAAIFASGVTTVLKYAVGRSRPSQGSDADVFRPFGGWNSFPSGHTTLAFAVATAIADQTEDGWSDVALYGLATATAFARVNGDRHWTSDVLAGALVGHLSARWLFRQGGLTAGPGVLGISVDF
jgi:membrane-associated phospholipid phosphatase